MRHLIDCKTLPEYDCSLLVPIWETILKEYEKLTNHYEYTNQLRKANSDAAKLNRLTGLIACYYLLRYQSPNAQKDLDYWKAPSNEEALYTLISQERTRIKIEALRNKKPVIAPDFDFDNMLVNIQNARGRDFIDIDKITVSVWVYECKKIEDKYKQLENAGRKNNSE